MSPVSPECHRSIGLRGTSSRPHHPGSYKLHWLPVRKRVVFKTVVLVWKCLNVIAPGYLSKLCVPVASASGHQYLKSSSSGLVQVPKARTTIGRRSFAVATVEQSSCCSPETGDDSAHFQETTGGLFVAHVMCWQTEGTFTTARCCCGVFVILVPDIKLQTYLLNCCPWNVWHI